MLEEALQGQAIAEEYAPCSIAHGQALGPALPSTRMEALSIYAVLALNGELSIDLDKQAAVNRMHRLLRRGPPRKPWGMQEDGDVWCAIYDNIKGLGIQESTEMQCYAGAVGDPGVETEVQVQGAAATPTPAQARPIARTIFRVPAQARILREATQAQTMHVEGSSKR